MNQKGSISVLHVVFLSMTVIGLKNHVTIIPSLLEDARRDGWISVIIAFLAIFPFVFLFIYIHKKSERKHLAKWLTDNVGKVPSAVIRYMVAIFLLILSTFTMVEMLEWIAATFLPKTPLFLLLLTFSVLCVLLAMANLQSIVTVNAIVLFGVVVLGFFVAFTNLQVKDYNMLKPFLEHGVQPVLKSAVYPASGFIELSLLLFIQHRVKNPFRWYHFAVMMLILLGLTIGPLVGAITEFGPEEATKQLYPAYEEWGLVSIGRFFEHLDFLSIYQWLTGAFIRIGLLLFIAIDLLGMTNDKKRISQIILPALFFMSVSLLLVSDHVFLKIKGDYVLTGTFVFLFLLTLFLVFAAKRSGRKSRKQPN
ncbi:GerAB/ArcD/ProY family transporter [Sporosarcina ureae]|uniref:GerAB/ArcD/ProY family transporter n=1 Tax=Sporosarcina ureae TaxID=1571 RepID=UPI000A17AF0D|nr:endospore germination permease [Sporosarcina ureae]ARK21556.1 spore gernimation protein [Sporosarcina ureae]